MSLKFKSSLKYKAMIDLTALIDLIFLLVAFFMVTSSLGSESSITVHLPKAAQTGEYKKSSMIISVTKKNDIFINYIKYEKNKLLEEFNRRKEKLGNNPVIIRGDKGSNYETIVFIMDILNQAGIPRFTLSTVK